MTADASLGTAYADLLATKPTETVETSFKNLNHDQVAKYLFTSGSTGMPKAVIMTTRMMCVNSVMPKSMTSTDEVTEPPVLLNWLPWNHCFGGNAILSNLTVAGGTLYIDGGRPVPGAFAETVQNLREIAPTAYSTVPSAYTMLVDELEKDDALAVNFFSKIRSLAYGGAALSQDLYERLQQVAIRLTGERIVFSSGYGATETAPTIMNVHWETERMGLLGLPLPGVEIKLAPVGQKMEVRVRGACITPRRRATLTTKKVSIASATVRVLSMTMIPPKASSSMAVSRKISNFRQAHGSVRANFASMLWPRLAMCCRTHSSRASTAPISVFSVSRTSPPAARLSAMKA